MGLLDPHGPTSLTPRAGRTEAPALLKPSLGLGAIGFRLVLPCLGLGTIEYHWFYAEVFCVPKSKNYNYYNWRNMETHQNSAVCFGTFRHMFPPSKLVKRAARWICASVRPWTCWSLPGAQCAELSRNYPKCIQSLRSMWGSDGNWGSSWSFWMSLLSVWKCLKK